MVLDSPMQHGTEVGLPPEHAVLKKTVHPQSTMPLSVQSVAFVWPSRLVE